MNITDEELLMLEHLTYLNEDVAAKADDLGDDSLRGGEGDDTSMTETTEAIFTTVPAMTEYLQESVYS